MGGLPAQSRQAGSPGPLTLPGWLTNEGNRRDIQFSLNHLVPFCGILSPLVPCATGGRGGLTDASLLALGRLAGQSLAAFHLGESGR